MKYDGVSNSVLHTDVKNLITDCLLYLVWLSDRIEFPNVH